MNQKKIKNNLPSVSMLVIVKTIIKPIKIILISIYPLIRLTLLCKKLNKNLRIINPIALYNEFILIYIYDVNSLV